MFRRAATVLASAALIATGAPAVPLATAAPVHTTAAASACAVKPIIPAVIVIGARPVRRTFTLRTTCALKAPVMFVAHLVDSRYTFRVGLAFRGNGHGVVSTGANAIFSHDAAKLAYGEFHISPTSVQVLGRPGLKVVSSPVNFALKFKTWTTAKTSSEDQGHYFTGNVSSFDGFAREPAVYPVLVQWRRGSTWVTVEKTVSNQYGESFAVALPMTGNRVYRAVAVPPQSYIEPSVSKSVLCSGADRPGGGC